MAVALRLSAAIATGSFVMAQEAPQVAPAPAPENPAPHSPAESKPETPAPTPPQIVAGDEAFLREAAQIHATGVELAKLAENNAGTEEVQAFSQELLVEHTRSLAAAREIGRMKNVAIEDGPTATQQAVISEFAGKIGQKFDEEYRAQALKNHEEAIRLFASAAKSAKDAEVRMFAERSLGEMKEKHIAMGGEALEFKGGVALKLPKTAKPTAKPTKGKAKPDPASTAIAASAPSEQVSATAPTTRPLQGASPSSAANVAAALNRAPESTPPGRRLGTRLPVVAEGASVVLTPEVARAPRVAVPDARARWTVPADDADAAVERRTRVRQARVVADVPDDEAFAAAPVARVVTRRTLESAEPVPSAMIEAPERRVIIRQVPARRTIRIFDGGGRDDDD